MTVSSQNGVGFNETEREHISVKNPVTGEVIGKIAVSTRQDVEDTVERARFAQKTWGNLSVQTRANMMSRWANLVWESQNEVIATIRRETGKTDGTAFSELIIGDATVNYYYHHAASILKSQTRNPLIPFVHQAQVHYHPYGVVGVISPWNFPFYLPFVDLIPALIAGNTVVLKPSEITPYSAEIGVELLYKAGVPRDVVQIVHGGGSTGSALVDMVDYVAFTGSTATGRKIAARAGERLIPCSVELGGKHPALVLNDADLEMTSSGLVRGSFENAGQFCMGIERAYVDESVYEPMLERIQHYLTLYTFGPGDGRQVFMGSLTNEREIERIEEHIQDALSKGATLLHGGKRRPDLGPLFFEPTVLTNVDHSMRVMREETFGPMLPIMKVHGTEEAIRLANDSDYGLAASVWTRDLAKGESVAKRLIFGDVGINVPQMVVGTPALPSGGRRSSGLGRRNGPEGLKRYVTPQSIVTNNGLGQGPTLAVLDDQTLAIAKVLRVISALYSISLAIAVIRGALMPGRYDVLNRVLQLDPRTQNQEIVQWVGFYEYPWMLQKSLEFALFRTYAVPSISALLAKTRQFHAGGQKRYDDTSLIIAEITQNGYDSERGRAAIRRMNQLHRRWDIPNEDYLYVLSTFIYVPIYFHQQFGWRTPTQHENLANYYFWFEVGRRMGIKDIPTTYEAFEQYHKAYEQKYFHYSDSNREIAELTVQTFLAWYPAPLRPIVREGLYTLMDEPLLRAFGYPQAHPLLTASIKASLKVMGFVIRTVMPPRKEPFHFTEQPNRTYPQGYTLESLGPTDAPTYDPTMPLE